VIDLCNGAVAVKMSENEGPKHRIVEIGPVAFDLYSVITGKRSI
jgi:hypothetical protein